MDKKAGKKEKQTSGKLIRTGEKVPQVSDEKKKVAVDPILDESGGLNGAVHIISEITERKLIEKALRESEGKLSAMLQSIGDHISMIDKDLNIIWANETARKIFGVDIIGRKCYEAYHRRKEPCEPYPCLTLKAFQDGKVHEHETQVIGKDGEIIYFHCTSNVALRDKDGKPTAVIEVSRDITEHKRMEEALRESEERFREIARVIPVIFWMASADGKQMLYVSPAFENIYGRPCDSLYENLDSWLEFIYPEDRENVIATVEKHHGEAYEMEYRIVRPDGSTRWIRDNIIPVRDRNGEIYHIIGFGEDITERKRSEEALKQSEERYRYIVETTNEGVWISDSEKLTTYVNTALTQMLGYEPEEMIGVPIESFIPAEDIADHNSQMAIRRSGKASKYERRLKRKDGSICYCLFSGTPMYDTEGRLAGAFAMVTDITELKMIEEALKKEKEFIENLIQTAQVIVLVLDTKGRIVQFNPYMESISGYHLNEVQGKDWFDTFLPGVARKHVRELFLKAIDDIQTKGNVNLIVTKDGREREIEWFDKTLKDSNGQTIGLLAIGRDITEQKRAEGETRVKMREIERLNRLFIGREHRMIELKREVNTLLERLGQPKKYETTYHAKERGENQDKEENREA